MDDTRASRIRDKLRRLREGDPLLQLHGALAHRYELGPRLSEAQLLAFEAAFGAALPEEYRWFLRELGDGGAGPRGLRALTSQGLDLDLATPSRLWWEDVLPASEAPGEAADAVATVDEAVAPAAAAGEAAAAVATADEVVTADLDAGATADAAGEGADADRWSDGEPLLAYLDRLRARWVRPRFDETDEALVARLLAAYEAEPEVRDVDTGAFEPSSEDSEARETVADETRDARVMTLELLGGQPTLVGWGDEEVCSGTLPLVVERSGERVVLVASGAERGHVWTETCASLARTTTGFLDWYEAWLDRMLDALGALPPPPAPTIAGWARALIAEARGRGEDPGPYLLAFHGPYGRAGLWPILLEILEEHGTPSPPLAQCRADALLELERFAEAERWYREADRGFPEGERHGGERYFSAPDPLCYGLFGGFWMPSPRWGLVRAVGKQGRPEEMLRELARLPPAAWRLIDAGNLAYDAGRFDQVVHLTSVARFLANVCSDEDNEVAALINRGNALLRLGRLDEARADYARADEKANIRPASFHYNLARLEATAGDHAAAMAHLEALVLLEDGDREVFDEDDLLALRDDPAYHERFVALAARAWWRRA